MNRSMTVLGYLSLFFVATSSYGTSGMTPSGGPSIVGSLEFQYSETYEERDDRSFMNGSVFINGFVSLESDGDKLSGRGRIGFQKIEHYDDYATPALECKKMQVEQVTILISGDVYGPPTCEVILTIDEIWPSMQNVGCGVPGFPSPMASNERTEFWTLRSNGGLEQFKVKYKESGSYYEGSGTREVNANEINLVFLPPGC